uniref:Uncharacterized protein n=1 Tax=Plectus sambesii TaxID=2011161 RepID=A0A914URQ1_9BILA
MVVRKRGLDGYLFGVRRHAADRIGSDRVAAVAGGDAILRVTGSSTVAVHEPPSELTNAGGRLIDWLGQTADGRVDADGGRRGDDKSVDAIDARSRTWMALRKSSGEVSDGYCNSMHKTWNVRCLELRYSLAGSLAALLDALYSYFPDARADGWRRESQALLPSLPPHTIFSIIDCALYRVQAQAKSMIIASSILERHRLKSIAQLASTLSLPLIPPLYILRLLLAFLFHLLPD